MKVNRETRNTDVLVSVQGSVDIYSSPELRGELKVALEQRAPRIVIDLEKVTFVDSSGLATLIEALQRVHEYQGKLVLCGLKATVLSVFQLTNLDNLFEIRPNVKAALEG
ncbi:MAG: STAS domain-containing protein [Planctomycetaceae bacterium]